MISGERKKIFSPQKYTSNLFQPKRGGFDQAFRNRFSFNKEEFHLTVNKPLKLNTMDILKL